MYVSVLSLPPTTVIFLVAGSRGAVRTCLYSNFQIVSEPVKDFIGRYSTPRSCLRHSLENSTALSKPKYCRPNFHGSPALRSISQCRWDSSTDPQVFLPSPAPSILRPGVVLSSHCQGGLFRSASPASIDPSYHLVGPRSRTRYRLPLPCLSGFGLFQMASAPSVTVINLLSHLVGPRSKTRYEMPLAYPVSRVDSDVSLFVYNPLRASTLTCDHIRIIGRIGVTGKGRAIRN